MLHEGLIIEKVIARLHILMTEKREELTKKVESEFTRMTEELLKKKQSVILEVAAYFGEFQEGCLSAMKRLQGMKHSLDFCPETKLDFLIKEKWETDGSGFLEDALANVFIEVDTFQSTLETLVRFQKWDHWLAPEVIREPTIFPVFGIVPLLYQLPDCTLTQTYAEFKHTHLTGGKVLYLPSGNLFQLDKTECILIDSDLFGRHSIGSLLVKRSEAGLVYYEGCVYVFGGLSQGHTLVSAECVDLSKRASRKLARNMLGARRSFCPCVWTDRIFLPGGITCMDSELFNLKSELFEPLPGIMNVYGPSIALPFSDKEVIVLANRTVHLFTKGNKDYKVLEEAAEPYSFETSCMPFKCQNRWFFLSSLDQQFRFIMELDIATKRLKKLAQVQDRLDEMYDLGL